VKRYWYTPKAAAGPDEEYSRQKKLKSIIAIKPKPPFRPVFQVAASCKGSNIRILNEPLEGSSVLHLIIFTQCNIIRRAGQSDLVYKFFLPYVYSF